MALRLHGPRLQIAQAVVAEEEGLFLFCEEKNTKKEKLRKSNNLEFLSFLVFLKFFLVLFFKKKDQDKNRFLIPQSSSACKAAKYPSTAS